MKPIVVSMAGASFVASAIVAIEKKEFIRTRLQNKYMFPGKDKKTRTELLKQIYELCQKAVK